MTPQPPAQQPQSQTENWPSYAPDPAWQPVVAAALADYAANKFDYHPQLQDYSSSGDYLNWSLNFWGNLPGVEQLDANGVPMIFYNGSYFYNPLTVSLYCLSEHGKFLKGIEPDLSKFWAGVDKLLELQQPDGSFQYTFEWFYLQPFHPPWTSGMAQAVSLSVFTRAWNLSRDAKYLTAGDRAFNFMSIPVSSGGDTQDFHFLDPSLVHRTFPDEMPMLSQSGYILNGFMYSMLGLYDWSSVPSSTASAAGQSFLRCVDTLDRILLYYDLGGFTAYDMRHVVLKMPPNVSGSYHAVHIELLHALGSITSDPTLAKYEMLWRSYVDK